jgi:hypothetical protein
MKNPDPNDEAFWRAVEEKSREQQRERRKKRWRDFRTFCLYASGAVFLIWLSHSCNSSPRYAMGYMPANVHRLTDDKVFRALAAVNAYPEYEEVDVSTRMGDTTRMELSGYSFEVLAIILRNGDRHTLREPLKEASFDEFIEVMTEDHVWRIHLVPSTEQTRRRHKPIRGDYPILHL